MVPGHGKEIFNIAVYRCSKQAYHEEVAADQNDRLAEISEQIGADLTVRQPDDAIRIRENVRRVCGGAWKYNQVVGWITVYTFGNQIRADLSFLPARRIARNFKRTSFQPAGRLIDMYVASRESNEEIFQNLLTRLTGTTDQPLLKTRYLDLDSFMNLGPHLNWRTLLGWA
jgi:hypothetical protein